MNKFKRFITPVTAAFMLLCLPVLAHASDNSVTLLPAEGNVQCSDYAANKVIESMDTSSLASSGTVTGPENPNDADTTGESADYTIDSSFTTLGFSNSTTPIDFAVVKSGRHVTVIMYASGGVYEDENITNDGEEISAFSLCYGLGNEAENSAPTLAIDPAGNKAVTAGDTLTFTVTATDDGLPGDGVLTISDNDSLPTGATLSMATGTDTEISREFSWTPTSLDVGGIAYVTFTASDGEFDTSEIISITVVEPEVTPACGLNVDKLDETGIDCPEPVYEYADDGVTIIGVTNPSVVCQWELGEDFFGFADGSDVCCICNGEALVKCDPDLPAGSPPNAAGEYSCNLTQAAKAELDLPAGEVTSIIEFNNDPYYCYTSGGSRICYCYGSLCPTR